MGIRFLLLGTALLLVSGCDRSASSDSSKPAASAASTAAGATTGAKGGTRLTARQISDANFAIFGPARMKDPFDAKLKDLKAKLGEPMKTEGDLLFWWGMGEAMSSGPYCQELKLDVAKQGAFLGQTDKSKCNM